MVDGFFRREYFPMAPNQTPKWHRLDSVVDDRTMVAVCGYSYRFILEEPRLKHRVATAKLRCKDCDRKAEKGAL